MNRSRMGASKFSQVDDAGSERSISQSILDIQRKQSGISSIIKLFSFLVMVVALLIGYKVYL